MKYALAGLLALTLGGTTLIADPKAECKCDAKCVEQCKKHEGKKHCKCEACDCAKTGKCPHGKCHHEDEKKG